jgi:hypothetical protein
VDSTATYRLLYDYDGTYHGNRSAFGNHAFVTLGSSGNTVLLKVFDACTGPYRNISLIDYFTATIDFAANAQDNALYGSSDFKETASELVSEVVFFNINSPF